MWLKCHRKPDFWPTLHISRKERNLSLFIHEYQFDQGFFAVAQLLFSTIWDAQNKNHRELRSGLKKSSCEIFPQLCFSTKSVICVDILQSLFRQSTYWNFMSDHKWPASLLVGFIIVFCCDLFVVKTSRKVFERPFDSL